MKPGFRYGGMVGLIFEKEFYIPCDGKSIILCQVLGFFIEKPPKRRSFTSGIQKKNESNRA